MSVLKYEDCTDVYVCYGFDTLTLSLGPTELATFLNEFDNYRESTGEFAFVEVNSCIWDADYNKRDVKYTFNGYETWRISLTNVCFVRIKDKRG